MATTTQEERKEVDVVWNFLKGDKTSCSFSSSHTGVAEDTRQKRGNKTMHY
jgi:hypothetical protein